MNLSLQVFEPEMSITTSFPRTRSEIERELGIKSGDTSKPLLLTLLEQIKYGGGGANIGSSSPTPWSTVPEEPAKPAQ